MFWIRCVIFIHNCFFILKYFKNISSEHRFFFYITPGYLSKARHLVLIDYCYVIRSLYSNFANCLITVTTLSLPLTSRFCPGFHTFFVLMSLISVNLRQFLSLSSFVFITFIFWKTTTGQLCCKLSLSFDMSDVYSWSVSGHWGNQLSQFAWSYPDLAPKVLHFWEPLSPGWTRVVDHSNTPQIALMLVLLKESY